MDMQRQSNARSVCELWSQTWLEPSSTVDGWGYVPNLADLGFPMYKWHKHTYLLELLKI